MTQAPSNKVVPLAKTSSEIITFTGKMFDPLNPDIDLIDIQDIAHGLANVARYGGQTNFFYSVAQHSCYMCDLLSDKSAFAGLMHDAAEAYLGDIVRPLKRFMAGYKDQEQKLETAIFERFDIDYDQFHNEIKLIDQRMQHSELLQITKLSEARPEYFQIFPPALESLEIEYWSPKKAKEEFLTRAQKLRPDLFTD